MTETQLRGFSGASILHPSLLAIAEKVASLMPCLQHSSATFMPASRGQTLHLYRTISREQVNTWLSL
jgi:hypothetical protein